MANDTAHIADGGASATACAPAAKPRALVWLHWITVLCLLLAAAAILAREQFDGRHLRAWLLELHRHFGLSVLLLCLLRLGVRLRAGRSPVEALPWPLRAAAWLTHAALYALLLALPLLGWSLSDAEGKPVHLLGLTLPHLVGEDEDLADRLQAWHVDAAWTLLALASLHVAAALWHHFALRDGVLRSMLPGRRR